MNPQKYTDAELRFARTIPLEVVMERMGAARDPKDKHNWHATIGGERCRITVNDDQFYNHTKELGNGGAISLAMHLDPGMTLPKAVAFLTGAEVRQASTAFTEKPKEAKRILPIPSAVANNLPKVIDYLTNPDKRAIPPEIIHRAIGAGRVWADAYGNAVFKLTSPELTGKTMSAELRGTYDKPFHAVRGETSTKGLFFTGKTSSKTALFTESSIESLSLEYFEPRSLIVGTVGASKEAATTAAKLLHARGFAIVSAFNDDKDGNRYAEWLKEAVPDSARMLPDPRRLKEYEQLRGKPGKDWNDQMVAVRHELEQTQQQTNQRGKQAELER